MNYNHYIGLKYSRTFSALFLTKTGILSNGALPHSMFRPEISLRILRRSMFSGGQIYVSLSLALITHRSHKNI